MQLCNFDELNELRPEDKKIYENEHTASDFSVAWLRANKQKTANERFTAVIGKNSLFWISRNSRSHLYRFYLLFFLLKTVAVNNRLAYFVQVCVQSNLAISARLLCSHIPFAFVFTKVQTIH